MKILVTGYTGQLGFDVVREGKSLGFDMIGIGVEHLDITDQDATSKYVREVKPDAIIHCAAYTAVDKAEDDKDLCWNVNVVGTKTLATIAKELHTKFIYISTDYVYDGQGETPFVETDATNPVNYYGQTKLEGEQVVQKLLTDYFIVRISWVFGYNGFNFVKTMLKLAETRNELNVVGDQFGSPTYTFDLAKLLMNMIQTDQYGIYHATNEGFCSWAEFAAEIFRVAGKDVKVNSIPSSDYPTKAARPGNSRMSKQKLIDNGFTLLPKWQDALQHYIKVLETEDK